MSFSSRKRHFSRSSDSAREFRNCSSQPGWVDQRRAAEVAVKVVCPPGGSAGRGLNLSRSEGRECDGTCRPVDCAWMAQVQPRQQQEDVRRRGRTRATRGRVSVDGMDWPIWVDMYCRVHQRKWPPRRAEAIGWSLGTEGYLRLPLESMVMPPGLLSFFSSLALRVPMALVRHSSALAISSFTAAASPKSTSALRR